MDTSIQSAGDEAVRGMDTSDLQYFEQVPGGARDASATRRVGRVDTGCSRLPSWLNGALTSVSARIRVTLRGALWRC